MKALTFLEYFNQEEKHIHPNLLENLKIFCYDKIRTYKDFVSQPFRPEMIVELFENSYLIGKKVQNYGNGTMISYKLRSELPFVDDLYRHLPTPITLNDFISDCQRAGIDLTFKEEISKKF